MVTSIAGMAGRLDVDVGGDVQGRVIRRCCCCCSSGGRCGRGVGGEALARFDGVAAVAGGLVALFQTAQPAAAGEDDEGGDACCGSDGGDGAFGEAAAATTATIIIVFVGSIFAVGGVGVGVARVARVAAGVVRVCRRGRGCCCCCCVVVVVVLGVGFCVGVVAIILASRCGSGRFARLLGAGSAGSGRVWRRCGSGGGGDAIITAGIVAATRRRRRRCRGGLARSSVLLRMALDAVAYRLIGEAVADVLVDKAAAAVIRTLPAADGAAGRAGTRRRGGAEDGKVAAGAVGVLVAVFLCEGRGGEEEEDEGEEEEGEGEDESGAGCRHCWLCGCERSGMSSEGRRAVRFGDGAVGEKVW